MTLQNSTRKGKDKNLKGFMLLDWETVYHVDKWSDCNETFLYTRVLQTLILISTLPFLTSILLTSNEMRLGDISLLDPTTKLPLSGSLDYPSLLIATLLVKESKNVRFIAGKNCSLAANKKLN